MNFRTLSVSKNEGIVTAAKEKRDKESAAVQPSPPPPNQKQPLLKTFEDRLHNNRITQKKVEMHRIQKRADTSLLLNRRILIS